MPPKTGTEKATNSKPTQGKKQSNSHAKVTDKATSQPKKLKGNHNSDLESDLEEDGTVKAAPMSGKW